jgi:hypothetical protein
LTATTTAATTRAAKPGPGQPGLPGRRHRVIKLQNRALRWHITSRARAEALRERSSRLVKGWPADRGKALMNLRWPLCAALSRRGTDA